MTTAIFEVRGYIYKISVTGHADFNPGNDPVCAAVSVLATTLAQRANDIEAMGLGKVRQQVIESGKVLLTVESQYDAWRHAVSTIITGFELLEYHYPAHVKLIRRVGE